MADAEGAPGWHGDGQGRGHEYEHDREQGSDREQGHGHRRHGQVNGREHSRAADAAPRPGSDGEHALQRRLGTQTRADRFYDDQVLDHLNARMREFIGWQEMFFLATADRRGECDNSFRAGPPGFLQVLGERTLVYPEYRGNGVHASLGNIQENPRLGILMVDFVRARIGLHVNGRAELVEDAEIRATHPDLPQDPVPGRRAQLWVRVSVEEAYIHCAKHIPHLQKAPKRTRRDWGTDDDRRKGGDFFGAARDARERGPVERAPRREHASEGTGAPVPAPAAAPVAPAPAPAPGPLPGSAPVPVPPPAPVLSPVASAQPPAAAPLPPQAPPPVPPMPATRPAVIPAVPTLPPEPEPAAWRAEAERALAEARRRASAGASEGGPSPFQSWFG